MKKKLLVISMVAMIAFTGCQKQNSAADIAQMSLSGKTITFEPNDKLVANAWNEADVTFRNKSYKKYPILYKGITIGSKLEDTIKAYDVKEGYAIVEREIDTCGDGTTETVTEEYKNIDFCGNIMLDEAVKPKQAIALIVSYLGNADQ